jgi:hypothetical protein
MDSGVNDENVNGNCTTSTGRKKSCACKSSHPDHVKTLLFIVLFFVFDISCNKLPYPVDYLTLYGFVVGKENCQADETQDYWLVDCTYRASSPQIGDTLMFNGITYTNVVKVKGLSDGLKKIGLPILIEYRTITSIRVSTIDCQVPLPKTYNLKEVTILNQGEIR